MASLTGYRVQHTSFVLAAMIAMFVAFLSSTGVDLPADQRRRGEPGQAI